MKLSEMQTLFGHSAWAMAKILEQADHLTDEQYNAQPGPGAQSIRQILTHMVTARQLWRMRFETGQTTITISPDDFPTVAAFRTGWEREMRALDRYLATLDDAALEGPFSFDRRGQTYAYTRWHVLFQLIGHDIQHRAELAERLTAHGYSPGDLDFFLFVSPVA